MMKRSTSNIFRMAFLGSLLALWAAPLRAQRSPGDRDAIIHLLQRATYGARPEDIARVESMGIEAWLEWQLNPAQIDDRSFDQRLDLYPAAKLSSTEMYAKYPPPQMIRQQMGGADSLSDTDLRRMGFLPPGRLLADLVGAKLQRAVYSERQLEAVMTDFWFNHFNVFWGKGPDKWLVSEYEEVAIRPNVFGDFEELLTATASHPAMLVYLDNWRSAVPDSASSRSRRRQQGRSSGLNENYARELMELHTLGVDGGYTQEDVVEVARAFTGWTISGMREVRETGRGEVTFQFVPFRHDRGEKIVLGHRLPAGRGIEDGQEVIRMLASHSATARHIATKLVQAFVADEPPPGLVDELAREFLDSDGDLRRVTFALFTAPEFYESRYRGSKIRSPFELIASALRLSDARVNPSRGLVGLLRQLDHMPYLETAPTGYPETNPEWVSSGAMLQRINFGLALAAGQIDGVSVEATNAPLAELIEDLLPGGDTDRLEEIVRTDLEKNTSRTRHWSERARGLVLGSPEFQRH